LELFGPLITLPQSITLNLGGTYDVTQLRCLPRQDIWANGNIVTYRIYTSTDGTHFTQIGAGSWADDHNEKSATFNPTRASYIRLEAVVGHGGHAIAAELNMTAAVKDPYAEGKTFLVPSLAQSSPVTPATMTSQPTFPQNTGGLPVAKSVPDKPGFVYNPFDPNSKVLLDVRGKAAGTKLKDPFSGKLFIVP
jgi:hypothetical protein